MKFCKSLMVLAASCAVTLFIACGDDGILVTNNYVSGIEIVDNVAELPECGESNEGDQVLVKGESTPRICVDGKWFATLAEKDTVIVNNRDTVVVSERDTVYLKGEIVSCTTESLADKSGIRVVCGGDSVGVVLNGKDGEKGDPGKDGTDGRDGVNGKDGAPGKDGIDGKDGEKGNPGKDGADGSACTAVPLPDNSGLKVLCNGDSVGVVLNGKDGSDGKDGENGKDGADGKPGSAGSNGVDGEKGDPGKDGIDGKGCTISQTAGSKTVSITCGDKTVSIDMGAGGIVSQDSVVLDSEKVAVNLNRVSGVIQKGPFLNGSKVLVHELEDGRILTQTGKSFKGRTKNDKGEFEVSCGMLVSQYVMMGASGYYRNEVTGDNSSSELTLYAITDVNKRNMVNINLLTHLEYERVIYLVTQKKLSVSEAKTQAQQEVFSLLHIDASDFSSSEDLSIAGSSDEDGALLAFSIIFQGDRTVAQLTELLQKVANDIEEDGEWSDADMRLTMAEWAADADSAGRLANFRSNVEGWELSTMVPNFEQYVRNFWYSEYGLDSCTVERAGEVAAATAGKRTNTNTRYICKDNAAPESETADWRWVIASDIEKDTYQWKPGKDGDLEAGDVTGESYVFDETGALNGTKGWRKAVAIENTEGICNESLFGQIRTYRGQNKVEFYQCQENAHRWVKTDDTLMIDTQGWKEEEDGFSKWGDRIGVVTTDTSKICYVYDTSETYRGWRKGNIKDCTLGLNGCTKGRAGEMKYCATDKVYFVCDLNEWVQANPEDEITCRNDGVCRLCTEGMQGVIEKRDGVDYICDGGWRVANCAEKVMGLCVDNDSSLVVGCEKVGAIEKDYICSRNSWHAVDCLSEYSLAAWNQKKAYYYTAKAHPEAEYAEDLVDERDGNVYKTVIIGGKRIMAENLRYYSTSAVNLKNQTWCYNGEEKNCAIGGRYYTWTAAVNLNSQWRNNSAAALIKPPHQGICPEGWHIPTGDEWEAMGNAADYKSQQMMGFAEWTKATDVSGFSALPVGYINGGFGDVGSFAHFWGASEYNSVYANTWNVNASSAYLSIGPKNDGVAVRCFQD